MFKIKVNPRFSDLDAMQHINNNRILEWFELGETDIYRLFTPDLDLSYEKWKLILVKKEDEFMGQIFFGKEVEIRTYIIEIGNSSFTMGSEVWQDNELKVRGKSVNVHFNYLTQKSKPIPENIKNKLKKHLIEEC